MGGIDLMEGKENAVDFWETCLSAKNLPHLEVEVSLSSSLEILENQKVRENFLDEALREQTFMRMRRGNSFSKTILVQD
ncbi:Uncharacterised protein [Bartonella quintana]|uniref:hypothetical protein n=1 Tax=Bartonella quintana TaxID=803 RepID=UPI0004A0508A|nr:hypothetical protein [Bartonella quintana]KEC69134.1 hypothetical protein O7Q_00079 [Bartonella quintana JK 39]SQF96452.1 Uncharacterised protein [Bartonella quintana]